MLGNRYRRDVLVHLKETNFYSRLRNTSWGGGGQCKKSRSRFVCMRGIVGMVDYESRGIWFGCGVA